MTEPSTITLRVAQPGELSACADCWIAMFEELGTMFERDLPSDWRERFVTFFSERVADERARFFVAVDGDDRIVGTAAGMLREGYGTVIHEVPQGYIFGVYVEDGYRGRGLATRLTQATVDFLKAKRCRKIRLHASKFGRRIYERLGFVPSSEMELIVGPQSG